MNTDTPENTEEKVVASDPQLTPHQEQVEQDFFNFMLSDEKYFHIIGPPGVGKSFTVKTLINNLVSKYEAVCRLLGIECKIQSHHLTATTNKAADAISEQTGMPASTIHTHMKLRLHTDYKTGKQGISRSNSFTLRNKELIFIDESSMIESPLFDIIDTSTPDCKIVFIGDKYQLAPVTEKISPIYRTMNMVGELSEPVRNKNSPHLMALCDQFRETVSTGVFKPIVEVPGVIDFIDQDQFKSLVDKEFLNPDTEGRILTYTNNAAKSYNIYIRSLRGYGKLFQVGEKLISASSYNVQGKYSISIEEILTVEDIVNNGQPITKTVYDKVSQEQAEFEVYNIIVSNKFGNRMEISIPYDAAHFQALSSYFSRNKDWVAYYYLKEQFLDLRPRDAITCYKAQGSTFDFVVLDLEDISKCNIADQVARMIYVAVSRPKTRIYCYGKLKPAYSGG